MNSIDWAALGANAYSYAIGAASAVVPSAWHLLEFIIGIAMIMIVIRLVFFRGGG